MAEPAPATWSAATLTHTQMNAEVRDTVRWLLGHSSNPKPHIRLRNTSAVSLTTGTWTDLQMTTAARDRGFGWSSVTLTYPSGGNPVIVAPVAGTYLVGASVEIDTAACNKALRILKGATVIVEHDITGVGSAAVARISVATLAVFAANDEIKAQGFQDSGSALNANSAGEFSPCLWAYYVATAS